MIIQRLKLGLSVLAIFALLSCGGGGSDSESSISTASSDSIVNVLLTDSPSDNIEQLTAKISKIEFIGDGQVVTVFEGSAEVDLLKLRDFYELFTITSIRSGTYQKISLHISDVTIVEEQAGGLVSTVATLPSPTIDVTPAAGFTIAGGQVLFLEIDFDVDKTVELMTEEGGNLILTPVIFIKIAEDLPTDKFIRIHGVVDTISHHGLRICDTQLISDIAHRHRSLLACANVLVEDETSVFGENGLPTYQGNIAEGDYVTVVGRINRRIKLIPYIPYGHYPPPGHCRLWYLDRSNGDQPPPERCDDFKYQIIPANAVLIDDQGLPVYDIFSVEALVIEKGKLTTFSRYSGNATTQVTDYEFGYQLDSDEQGLVTEGPISALLFPETRIFSSDGIELNTTMIQPELEAVLDGIPVLSNTAPDAIRTAFIVANLDEDAEQWIRANVLTVDPVTSTLTVDTGLRDRCVDAESAHVFRITKVDDRLLTEEIALGQLKVDQPIDIFGSEGNNGCFVAETIFAYRY